MNRGSPASMVVQIVSKFKMKYSWTIRFLMPDGCPRDLRVRLCEVWEAFFDLCGNFPKDDKVHGHGALRLRVLLRVRVAHPVYKLL